MKSFDFCLKPQPGPWFLSNLMVSNKTEGEVVSECTRLYSQTTFRNWQIIPVLNKGLKLILDLGPNLKGGDNWYWSSLRDWLDLRLWRMSWNRAEVTSTRYWVKWRHFQICLAYLLILASAFGRILPLRPVNHHHQIERTNRLNRY